MKLTCQFFNLIKVCYHFAFPKVAIRTLGVPTSVQFIIVNRNIPLGVVSTQPPASTSHVIQSAHSSIREQVSTAGEEKALPAPTQRMLAKPTNMLIINFWGEDESSYLF